MAKERRPEEQQDETVKGTLGRQSGLGCKIILTRPGAKYRQEEATDNGCRSPTLLREVIAIRKATSREAASQMLTQEV